MVTRVKICGLTNPEDANWAAECGADALGFVFEPSSPRFVSNQEWIHREVLSGPFITKVAVYGHVACTEFDGFDVVQAISGTIDSSLIRARRILAVPVTANPLAIHNLLGFDALLLDAILEGEMGGTGRKVDWHAAARLVDECPIPVILAGGLTPENVSEAIRAVRPYGVDVSSGVESFPGKKDPSKIQAFIQAAKSV